MKQIGWRNWLLMLFLSVAFVFVFYSSAWMIMLPTLAMIGLHELGHLYAAKYYGLETGGFVFLPGLGGVALLKEWPQELWKIFVIAYAGPLAGLAQILVLMIAGLFFNYDLIPILIVIWSVINLFNLLPALPLDGGKISWSIAGSKVNNYFNSVIYYFMTFYALVVIFLIAGWIWAGIIAFVGFNERRAFLNKEKMVVLTPMTTKQCFAAFFLYLLLAGAFILIIACELNQALAVMKPQ